MVDQMAVGYAAVGDRFGAVAVGVEQERAVVVLAVLRPRTGCAVVSIPGLCPDAPELVHQLPRRRGEADVEAARRGMPGVGSRERELPFPDRVLLVAA